jgi:hypothetical protein
LKSGDSSCFFDISYVYHHTGIIFSMPTPFYHLSLAEKLLSLPSLSKAIQQFLQVYRGEFLFGSTAADVQVVSGQSRESTHFFDVPIRNGDRAAWEVMLSMNPSLAVAEEVNGPQAAFIAGYLCHLQADWIWVKEIFASIFGPVSGWGSFKKRLYYHNVLRAYLDLNILPDLPDGLDIHLSKVNPSGWLPFIKDECLLEWRDFITPQLQAGGTIQTVEVFSSRQGISAPEFYAMLDSEDLMQQQIFSHISLDRIEQYNLRLLEENQALLYNYLAFTLHPTAMTINRGVFRGVQS